MIHRSTDKPMNKFSFKGMSIALGIRDIIKLPTHKILHQILHKIDLIKPGAVILDYGCGPGNCTIAASAELVSPSRKVYA